MRLAACTGAAALLQLDGTLITVALPSVARGLKVSSASTAIILSAYFGAYAIVLLHNADKGAIVIDLGAQTTLCGVSASCNPPKKNNSSIKSEPTPCFLSSSSIARSLRLYFRS